MRERTLQLMWFFSARRYRFPSTYRHIIISSYRNNCTINAATVIESSQIYRIDVLEITRNDQNAVTRRNGDSIFVAPTAEYNNNIIIPSRESYYMYITRTNLLLSVLSRAVVF